MIGPVFGIVGFLWGFYLARQRGGKTLDRLQYGVRIPRHPAIRSTSIRPGIP